MKQLPKNRMANESNDDAILCKDGCDDAIKYFLNEEENIAPDDAIDNTTNEHVVKNKEEKNYMVVHLKKLFLT